MKHIRLPAPAKLNLCLHINHQREDGYHELQTLFQFVDLCDYLEFDITESPEIQLISDLNDVKAEDNLIVRAAQLLQQHQTGFPDIPPKGAIIRLEKRVPMGAGLGGGSSDAATTLVALNILWKIDLSLDQLCELGLTLGADVPVFIHGHACWAEGVGEKFSPANPQTHSYLIIQPDCMINTGEIFSDKRLTRDTPKMKIAPALEGHIPNLFEKQGCFKNDCEKVVRERYPEVDEALNWLDQFANARLTGTGSCLFAEFDSLDKAKEIASKAPSNVNTFAVKAMNISPLVHCLRELEKSSA